MRSILPVWPFWVTKLKRGSLIGYILGSGQWNLYHIFSILWYCLTYDFFNASLFFVVFAVFGAAGVIGWSSYYQIARVYYYYYCCFVVGGQILSWHVYFCLQKGLHQLRCHWLWHMFAFRVTHGLILHLMLEMFVVWAAYRFQGMVFFVVLWHVAKSVVVLMK